jgi:hypothetical protein
MTMPTDSNSNSIKSPRPSEWATPRGYIVPRDFACPLPPGTAWVGDLRILAMGPYIASVVIRAEDWGPAVAPHIRGLIVVPGVQARALSEGHWSGAWPGGMLTARSCNTVRFREGDRLTVGASSGRQGELVVVPFGVTMGPRLPTHQRAAA